MKMKDLTYEKIQNYDPLNKRADKNGMITEWVAKNAWGNSVAFGNTKAECQTEARRYVARKNAEGERVMRKEKIKITCYGKTEIWADREKAKLFYLDCMANSEGAERDRYVNIYLQLMSGETECFDE